MNFRKIGLAAAALAVPLGFAVATSSLASATTPTHTVFQGTLSSDITGAIKFVPALTLTASTGTVKVVTNATLSNLSGTTTYKGTTITGGKYHSVVVLPAGSSCLSLEGGLPNSTGRVTYTSTGTLPAAPTTLSWGSTTTNISSSPISATLSNPTVKGSFTKPSGSLSTATLYIKQSESTLLTDCETTGLAKLTFGAVKTDISTLNLG
jgi:hypothetical protein